jgi:hypothetical protein
VLLRTAATLTGGGGGGYHARTGYKPGQRRTEEMEVIQALSYSNPMIEGGNAMRRMLCVGVVLLPVVAVVQLEAQQLAGPRVTSSAGQGVAMVTDAMLRIPFTLQEEDFEGGRPAVVSIRIRNLLGQLVAIPLAVGHPGGSVSIEDLEYPTPGQKEAIWDGVDRNGHRAASGVYLLELVVNGVRAPPQRIVVDN